MRFAYAIASMLAACGGGGANPDGSAAPLDQSVPADGGGGPPGSDDGGGPPTPLDSGTAGSGVDLATLDLAGFTNCYGVAICDPGTAFCIRYWTGSQATPGMITSGPACYQPTDTCANQGQPMNCSCIQSDSGLGSACAGSCVDHMDGTYDCYKQ